MEYSYMSRKIVRVVDRQTLGSQRTSRLL